MNSASVAKAIYMKISNTYAYGICTSPKITRNSAATFIAIAVSVRRIEGLYFGSPYNRLRCASRTAFHVKTIVEAVIKMRNTEYTIASSLSNPGGNANPGIIKSVTIYSLAP